jgi:ATP-dependent DNA helicase RecG
MNDYTITPINHVEDDEFEGFDLNSIYETYDLECKAAQGKDGRGELPEDFWKTYSAMANAEGGVVFLGIQEKPVGQFQVLGLQDVARVRKALWDLLNNRNKVSLNLLQERHVAPVQIDGKTVLRVRIPRATRHEKPVHLGGNPLTGTYIRRHEGDYAAPEEAVRRMLAERVEDARDERVLQGFDLSDLDMDTVAAYRNRFTAVKGGHAWIDLSIPEFLEKIGAWGKDREKGFSGLRLAGLLMFGRAEVIVDALPNYNLDFVQRPEARTENRWVDRLTPDGTWSGNVYDFFRKVYLKLTSDLKVPFQLQEGQRIDDTPVHVALREALANTLIHADYTGRASVLVVKRPDMFGFRNPGLMRVSVEQAIQGSLSDCRNRRLQTMFSLVGYGEKAGSGVPQIYSNWKGQHWRQPKLYEVFEADVTLMELRMLSLLPQSAFDELEAKFGEQFKRLPELERLVLAVASCDGVINHTRVKELSTDHSTDISKTLAKLVKEQFLQPEGVGRGMVYRLPWQKKIDLSLFDVDVLPVELGAIPTELEVKPTELGAIPTELIAANVTKPQVYQSWDEIPLSEQVRLMSIAESMRAKSRVEPLVLQSVVFELCQHQYLSRRILALLLGRNSADLWQRTLKPMLEAKQLKPAHITVNHPKQAYMSERT